MPAPSTKTSRTRWPGAFGAIIDTSTSDGGDDPVEANGEAVREHQRFPRREVLLDVGLVDLGLMLIRDEDHDDVGPLRRVGNAHDPEAGRLRLVDRLARRRKADDHVDGGVLEVERMGVALRTVPDDGDLLLADQRRCSRPGRSTSWLPLLLLLG